MLQVSRMPATAVASSRATPQQPLQGRVVVESTANRRRSRSCNQSIGAAAATAAPKAAGPPPPPPIRHIRRSGNLSVDSLEAAAAAVTSGQQDPTQARHPSSFDNSTHVPAPHKPNASFKFLASPVQTKPRQKSVSLSSDC